MSRRVLALVLLAVLSYPSLGASNGLRAQAQIGLSEVIFVSANPKSSGKISTSMVYPSDQRGFNVPIRKRVGGWPVVVALHGFGRVGAEYFNLASELAERGFIVLLPNTARNSREVLYEDTLAIYDGVLKANAQTGSILKGAVATQRIGLVGHSYGGSTCARILGENIGFKAGLAIAPVFTGSQVGNARVPFAVVHGDGDALISARDGRAVYKAATSFRDLKFFALLSDKASHLNVAGMELASDDDRSVWSFSAALIVGFFQRFLQDDLGALHQSIGAPLRSDARLKSMSLEVDAPQLWHDGDPEVGGGFDISVCAEPGFYGLLMGTKAGALPTPFGELGIDPSVLFLMTTGVVPLEKVRRIRIDLPNNPGLVGLRLHWQGIAKRARLGLRLTPVNVVAIQKAR